MKNPLRKRLPREFAGELGKYLVIFLLMTLTIGFVSGFLVADNSMIIAYNESFEKYNIEDGNFRTDREMTTAQKEKTEKLGVTLYDNLYVEEAVENGSTLRIFKNREQVNLVCLMDGAFPEKEGEIAIDRMYADNNHLSTGDVLTVGGREMSICGLVALSDYSTLFSDNNDTMFDSVKFGVAIVTQEGFDAFGDTHLRYGYSWKYDTAPADKVQEKDMAEEFMKGLAKIVTLEDFIPQLLNQAIQFTGEDMGSDKAMMTLLLYIVIAIMAFVFGITINSTIVKEANVIGSLRAIGYTKGELVRHYMAMPLLVTLAGAVVGNLLGYSVFRVVCAGMYYGSYSLPTYHTVWNGEAFLLTTLVPMALMLAITFMILWRRLSLSPLQFLRRDLKKSRRRRALRLNRRIQFFTRFRIRVILQNVSNYAMLFVGIIFANMLLMFGLLFPSDLDYFQRQIVENKLCDYQYILKTPLSLAASDTPLETLAELLLIQSETQTSNPDAEKFAVTSLKTLGDGAEEIMVYGVSPDSRYVQADFQAEGVYISTGCAGKFHLRAGDTLTLKEPYADDTYDFTVAGVYDYPGAMSLFMTRELFNETFGYNDDYFSGYFSDSEITDIPERYIASVIDEDALTKVSRQLDVSMGSMMIMLDGFAVLIFMVLIYLLSKVVIEKNEQSISMVKILGYTQGEIARLYILATSLMVGLFVLISLPVEYLIMKWFMEYLILEMMSGWIPYYVDPILYVKVVLLGLCTYAVVAALEYRRIGRVPMQEALKNVE